MSKNSGKIIRKGQWPAMLTPFRSDGTIDYDALSPLVEFYIGHNAAGLFAACWSSEAQLFTAEETVKVCRHVHDSSAGRAQVVAGALAAGASDLIDLIRALGDLNVAAVVVTAGQVLGDCPESECIPRFRRLLDALPRDLPLGIYECPTPVHRLLSPETLGWLASSGRFVFHKDTCCNIDIICAKIERCRGTKLAFFNANTPTLIRSLQAGADGYCGIGSNFWPEVYSWLCSGGFRDEVNASTVDNFLLEQEPRVAAGCYPINAKSFLAARGLPIQPHVRLNRNATNKASLENLVEEMGQGLASIRPFLNRKSPVLEVAS